MRSGTPGFVGARLREARQVRSLSAVALAEIAGVSSQSIYHYEGGKASPRPDVLASIARAVNLPEQFFTRPQRATEQGTVFWRSMSSATKSARARAEWRFAWLRDIVRYLSDYVTFPQSNFPKLTLPSDPLLLSDAEIEDAAEEVRRYWRMGDGPIGNVVRLLENHGAIIARDKLGADTLDGLSEFVAEEQRPYIIVGTDKGSSARWRLDAAHELGHIILHSQVDRRLLARPEHFKRIEQQAHRFAAAFLLPIASFDEDVFAVNLDTLRSVKQKWGVSIQMMIFRARHAGLISEDAERRLWVNLSRRGWRRNEPYDDVMEAEKPTLLRRSFEMVLSERAQTPQDIVAALALPASDIEALSGLPRGYMDQDFAPVKLRARSAEPSAENTTRANVIDLPIRPRTT
jgi:Zn-dependent peptidase ImmA (M78 family)/transcriptional regulator with XRE-family HTH domain